MTAADSPQSTAPISNALRDLDVRVRAGKAKGRETDELLRELAEASTVLWPEDPHEGFDLALELYASLIAWHGFSGGTRTGESTIELAVWRLSRVLRSMEAISTDQLGALLEIWRQTVVIDRQLLGQVIVDALNEDQLRDLANEVRLKLGSLKSDFDALPVVRTKEMKATPSAGRDLTLLLVEIHMRLGELDEAQLYIQNELGSDPKVMVTHAELCRMRGQLDEAADRLRRTVIIEDDPSRLREALIDVFLEGDDYEAAIDQLLLLLEETGEILYWYVLTEHLKDQPDRLEAVRRRLQETSPPLYADVMMTEGDLDAVKLASRAKTFSHEQLWRIGDFLAEARPKTAARVYERAITLQGTVSQSRVQAGDLAQRMETVAPFFERLGRPTKLRRLAREILRKNRNNVPLRREFERMFDRKFN